MYLFFLGLIIIHLFLLFCNKNFHVIMILGDKMLTRVKNILKIIYWFILLFVWFNSHFCYLHITRCVSIWEEFFINCRFLSSIWTYAWRTFDRIKNGSNLIYSFRWEWVFLLSEFLNYLSSPFNIIIFLFDRNNLLTSFSFIIGLKAVMSS